MGKTKAADHMTKFKTGEKITWTSGAAGTVKAKTGVILAVLIGEESPEEGFKRVMPKSTPMPARSAFKSGHGGWRDRYLIRVQPPAKKRPGVKRGYTDPNPVYYAPLVRVIDGDSASAGKLAKS